MSYYFINEKEKTFNLEMLEQGRNQTALLSQLVDNANKVPEKVLTPWERMVEATRQLMSKSKTAQNKEALSRLTECYANR